MDQNMARELHFNRLQRALEEGLRSIEAARTPAEAEAARRHAKARIDELNRIWNDTFGVRAHADR